MREQVNVAIGSKNSRNTHTYMGIWAIRKAEMNLHGNAKGFIHRSMIDYTPPDMINLDFYR